MRHKQSLIVTLRTVMALSLATLLTACVSVPTPNETYLRDCHIPYLDGELGTTSTNEKVVELAEDREFALRMCNVDKAALRAWYDAQCRGWRKRCVPSGK